MLIGDSALLPQEIRHYEELLVQRDRIQAELDLTMARITAIETDQPIPHSRPSTTVVLPLGASLQAAPSLYAVH